MRETIDYSAERSWFSEGDHPLEPRERDRLQRALDAGEAIARFVRGRSDGRPAVWAASDRRIVCCTLGWFGSSAVLDYASVAALQVEEGAHGWTIRLDSSRGREALVAVPPSLGRSFVAHLESVTGKAVTFLPSRRTATPRLFVARQGAPGAGGRAAHEPPPMPANPAPADHTAVGLTTALREAADLHRSGALTDDEYAALKRRLLGG
jgi:hypothetical protein